MRTLYRLFLVGIFFISTACQKPPKKFENYIAAQKCEKALEELPQKDMNISFAGQAEVAAGKALSYSVAGLGYTTGFLLKVVSGTVLFVGVCAPVALAASYSSTPVESLPFEACPGVEGANRVYEKVPGTRLGDRALKATTSWRCPDLTPVSRSLRSVSRCYAARGDAKSLKKAKATLESISSSPYFQDCIEDQEKALVLKRLYALK